MTCMDDEFDNHGGPNLAERIRRLANGRNTLDVAQFQFIGLDAIRTGYAGRWDEKRDHVFHVAKQFIAKRIAAEDVLISSYQTSGGGAGASVPMDQVSFNFRSVDVQVVSPWSADWSTSLFPTHHDPE